MKTWWREPSKLSPTRGSVGGHGGILKSAMECVDGSPVRAPGFKKDADYVFFELTCSICPVCRTVIDAQILIRDNKVYMRKRCAQHGPFEALVYGDAGMYT